MSFKKSVMGSGIAAAAANVIVGDVATVAGVGTAQAGAALVGTDTVNMTTASGQTGFVLPTAAQGAQVGDSCSLYCASATTALVYPGGAETANASTSAISVAQNKLLMLKRVSATNWGYIVTA